MNKQLNYITYLRSFAIIAIVIYHSFCPYMRWKIISTPYYSTYKSIFEIWFGARMPLFLFISGFLFSYLINYRNKYQSYIKFIINKSERLLIPYIVFASLIMLTLNKLSWFGYQNGYWHLWFLQMLFLSFIVIWPLHLIKKFWIHIILLIGFSILSIYYPHKIRFGISYLLKYFVWFYWGYIIAAYYERIKLVFNYKTLLIFAFIWLSSSFIRDNFAISIKALLYVTRYLTNISFILFIFISTYLLNEKGVLKEHPVVSRINQNSYGIYIFHAWIIATLFYVHPFAAWIRDIATKMPIAFPIMLSIFTFSISFVFSYVFLKTRLGKFLIG